MTIIVFLVDTSASMNQRAYVNGRKTLLDVAKEAVEVFVKQRQKSTESRGDRYMLLTFDEFPRNIKAGWKENLTTFMAELKNLEASGMTTLGSALKAVFDTLNINRMQSGIDMYGQGRYPYYLEPAVIVVVTDGGKLTTAGTVQRDLILPMGSTGTMGGMAGVPGAELTREPFRWDQRLYALVLRMAGHPPMSGSAGESGHVASDSSPVDAMCEVTGGRSYAVTSNRVLHQCIESLVQKLQSGVVIHFEKTGNDPPLQPGEIEEPPDTEKSDVEIIKSSMFRELGTGSRPNTPNQGLTGNQSTPPTPWHSCRKLIYVQRSAQKGFAVGFWPLPESFWPDVNAIVLPSRSAHPTVKFTCTNQEPMIIDNLPFDKYELEPSPLTLFILGRKQPNYCWQVFIQGSTKMGDTGHPFGYLKASTNLLTVNLFVLPYNYPMLLPLLDDLFKLHRLKPTNEWRTNFHNYLRTMPSYYAGPLRRALTRMGAGSLASSLIPENMENSLSYSVLNYLKRLKNQAKQEYDRIVSMTPYKGKFGPDGIKVIPRSQMRRELMENPSIREQLTDFPGYMLGLPEKAATETHPLRNPFDISRSALLDQIVRMRSNLLYGRGGVSHVVDEDTRHSLPIAQMGNYQDYLKKQPVPLRELESPPVRQHMFGNPYKTNKNLMMMTDEVGLGDVDEVQIMNASSGGQATHSSGAPMRGHKRPAADMLSAPPKRRKGPLPKDFKFQSPLSSPVPKRDYPNIDLKPDVIEMKPNMMLFQQQQQHQLPQPPLIHHQHFNGNNKPMMSPSQPSSPLTVNQVVPNEYHVDAGDRLSLRNSIEEKNVISREEPPVVRPATLMNNHKSENFKNNILKKLNDSNTLGGTQTIADTILSNMTKMQSPGNAWRHHNGQQQSELHHHLHSGNKPQVDSSFHKAKVKPALSTATPSSGSSNLQQVVSTDSGPLSKDTDKSVPHLSTPENNIKCQPSTEPVVAPSSHVLTNGPSSIVVEERVLTEDELRSITLRNNNVRQLIYKEVKRPGKVHTNLWKMLDELHGPPWVRRQFIQEVKLEALRFKRSVLATQLEDRCQSLS
eukprot:TRINITY_DN1470_c0_g1_i11.p1 TRINITY_DN1470_c0_g1~~TRINITY_DN1470_c0_g1_i11.p1  ORF type:complete len:1068 (-),score=228.93 TRINITY_DN1470_c0_g1_i11:1485-4688(-)